MKKLYKVMVVMGGRDLNMNTFTNREDAQAVVDAYNRRGKYEAYLLVEEG